MDRLGVAILGCFTRILCNLLSMRNCSVSDALVVSHFKHSPLAYSRLEDMQMELNMPKGIQVELNMWPKLLQQRKYEVEQYIFQCLLA